MKLATSVAIFSSTLAVASAERDGTKTRTGGDISMSMADAELSMPEETIVTLEEDEAAMADDVPGGDYSFSMNSKSGKVAKSPATPECGFVKELERGICVDEKGEFFDTIYFWTSPLISDEECEYECTVYVDVPGFLGYENNWGFGYCGCFFDKDTAPEPILPFTEYYMGPGLAPVAGIFPYDSTCAQYKCTEVPPAAGKSGKTASFSYDFSMNSKAGKGDKECGYDILDGVCVDGCGVEFGGAGIVEDVSHEDCIEFCSFFEGVEGYLGREHSLNPGRGEYCACLFEDGKVPQDLPDPIVVKEYPSSGSIIDAVHVEDVVCAAYTCAPKSKAGKCAKADMSYSYDFSMNSKAGKGGKVDSSFSYGYPMDSKSGKGAKAGFKKCTFANPILFGLENGLFEEDFIDEALMVNEKFADLTDAWLEGASPEFIAIQGADLIGLDPGQNITEIYLCGVMAVLVEQMRTTCFFEDYYSAYVNTAANFILGAAFAFGFEFNVLICPHPIPFPEYVPFGLYYEDQLAEETLEFIFGEAGETPPSLPLQAFGDVEGSFEQVALAEAMSIPTTSSMSMSM